MLKKLEIGFLRLLCFLWPRKTPFVQYFKKPEPQETEKRTVVAVCQGTEEVKEHPIYRGEKRTHLGDRPICMMCLESQLGEYTAHNVFRHLK